MTNAKTMTVADKNKAALLEAIVNFPGSSALELTQLTGIAGGTIHGIADRLRGDGTIVYSFKKRKTGKISRNVRTFCPVKTEEAEDLRKELEELREWKAGAIEKVPSLKLTPAQMWAKTLFEVLECKGDADALAYLEAVYEASFPKPVLLAA